MDRFEVISQGHRTAQAGQRPACVNRNTAACGRLAGRPSLPLNFRLLPGYHADFHEGLCRTASECQQQDMVAARQGHSPAYLN